jgi:ParB family chromosome partitioning protein
MGGGSVSGKRDKPYGGKLSALDTLFGDAPEVAAELVPIGQVKTRTEQPRRYFGEAEMRTLVASVREHGILQPILVRPSEEGTLELVAGERRLRAATEIGLAQVPVVVREMSKAQAAELALLENLQRENLNPIEETDAILSLLSARLRRPVPDVKELLRKLYDEARGRSGNNVVSKDEKELVEAFFSSIGRFSASSFYTHRLPLLRLPADLLEAVRCGKLEYTKALAVSKVKDEAARENMVNAAITENLSLAQLKASLKEIGMAQSDAQTNVATRASGIARTLRRRDAVKDVRTQKRVEKLLKQLEDLLKTAK